MGHHEPLQPAPRCASASTRGSRGARCATRRSARRSRAGRRTGTATRRAASARRSYSQELPLISTTSELEAERLPGVAGVLGQSLGSCSSRNRCKLVEVLVVARASRRQWPRPSRSRAGVSTRLRRAFSSVASKIAARRLVPASPAAAATYMPSPCRTSIRPRVDRTRIASRSDDRLTPSCSMKYALRRQLVAPAAARWSRCRPRISCDHPLGDPAPWQRLKVRRLMCPVVVTRHGRNDITIPDVGVDACPGWLHDAATISSRHQTSQPLALGRSLRLYDV